MCISVGFGDAYKLLGNKNLDKVGHFCSCSHALHAVVATLAYRRCAHFVPTTSLERVLMRHSTNLPIFLNSTSHKSAFDHIS
jgi:Tfp pilus assembly ATPase PilU